MKNNSSAIDDAQNVVITITYFNEIIRGVLIKETLLSDLSMDYLALIGFSLLFAVASILKFKKYVG